MSVHEEITNNSNTRKNLLSYCFKYTGCMTFKVQKSHADSIVQIKTMKKKTTPVNVKKKLSKAQFKES